MRTIVSRYTFLTPPALHQQQVRGRHTKQTGTSHIRCTHTPNTSTNAVFYTRRELCTALLLLLSIDGGRGTNARAETLPRTANDSLVCYRDDSIQFWRPKDWTEDRLRRQQAVRNTLLRREAITTTAKGHPNQGMLVLAAFQSPLFPESDHLSVISAGLDSGAGLESAEILANKFVNTLRSRPAVASARVRSARNTRHVDQRVYADFEIEVFGRMGWHRQNACSVIVHENRLYTFTLQSRAEAWHAARFLACRDSFLAGVDPSIPLCPV